MGCPLWIFFRTLCYFCTIQTCSGITRGRVLNGEIYTQRLRKLIYLHLVTDCCMKIALESSEQYRGRGICKQMQIN